MPNSHFLNNDLLRVGSTYTYNIIRDRNITQAHLYSEFSFLLSKYISILYQDALINVTFEFITSSTIDFYHFTKDSIIIWLLFKQFLKFFINF